ncbi:RNA polymerase sigma factor [Halioxenophilus sp. WMMB6]|uniref:RNA polymerase sigma factor n=1 Tax=Halioxenophilus sp. WMMB6 TaxID=3073815 RepID=UPI00295EBAEF|nr:RNA polymerase sigma factor [Halioxenophilus sp. WMMB6]
MTTKTTYKVQNAEAHEDFSVLDTKAPLEQVFTSHAQGLVRFLYRKVKNWEDAEDIAQNAFIRIQRLTQSGELENPKAYLYQTASNLAIDKIRREKLHTAYIQSEMIDSSMGIQSNDTDNCCPERQLGARQQLQKVEAALAQLPVKCRQAFMLHRVRNMSYNDIAQEMNVSVSSVEKYILQALKHCRKSLKDA